MTPKPNVVARLTAARSDKSKLIIEVHADATYNSFYHFHTQEGNRRSTKMQIRVANRNASLPVVNAHLYAPGLEAIAEDLQKRGGFTSIKVRILKKRLYKKLITCAPDVLGMARTSIRSTHAPVWAHKGIAVVLPTGYVSPLRRRELAKIGVR